MGVNSQPALYSKNFGLFLLFEVIRPGLSLLE